MPRHLRSENRLAVGLGRAVLGCGVICASVAKAADIDPGYAPEYRTIERERIYTNEPPILERRYPAIEERCRIIFERRIDPYGRETMHRVRACDEAPVYPYPNRAFDPALRDYPSERYYERSRYRAYPRPPAEIDDY